MKLMQSKTGRKAIQLAAVLLTVQLTILHQAGDCLQVLDDDDGQLEAYQHEDIGRISGGASQVASHRAQRQQINPPKPNRITLVPKRDPDFVLAAPTPLATSSASPTPVDQAAPQLPAAPRAQPNFGPLAPRQLHQHQVVASAPSGRHHEQSHTTLISNNVGPAVASSPALASFRSTGTSVSARHSALIAQVAAERAAAAGALEQPPPPPTSLVGASLGSPVEAPSDHHFQHHQAQVAPPAPPQAVHSAQESSFGNQPVAAPSSNSQLVDQPEEPQVAPSFEQVLGGGCPPRGVFSYENKDHCDRYYLCTNGTFTEEVCPNGLLHSQMGAVYQHCAYNYNVDCGRKKAPEPISSPGCPWQFGIFPIAANGQCSIDYFVCEWGVPETKRCTPEGLFYDDRIKGCQWADQLGCKSEALLNFKCPSEDEDNPYWPYPRYYHNTQNVIVCVNEQPRLVHCTEDQLVEPSSLACVDIKKKKKKFQQQ